MNDLCVRAYENSRSKGFWNGPVNEMLSTKLLLIHSEVSEAVEADRKGNPLCAKPIDIDGVRISSIEEEIADILIRVFDICGRHGWKPDELVEAKMRYNAARPQMHGGKQY